MNLERMSLFGQDCFLAFLSRCQNGFCRKLLSSSAQSCSNIGFVAVNAKTSGGKCWRMAMSVAPVTAWGARKSSNSDTSCAQPDPDGARTGDWPSGAL